jgi:hypothetical protein
MKILVVGAPFSGTRQMYNMLRSAGYEVGYNCQMSDGMVSELKPVNYYYANGYDYKYQIVSNPFYTISVLAREKRRLRIAAEEWLTINTTAVNIAKRCLRIEYINDEWPVELYRPKAFSRFAPVSIKPVKRNKLLSLGDVGTKILNFAERFGYGE